jgi:hypothetical protein
MLAETQRAVVNCLAYAWAGPNTLLGLLAAILMLLLGARIRVVSGTCEVAGGAAGRAFVRLPPCWRFRAMTLGHVILGVSHADLALVRAHEQVHVRQYECWGPFFLPAYLLSSAWQLIAGRRAYLDNFFERQAFAIQPCATHLPDD